MIKALALATACHVVEVDIETLATKILRYVALGRLVNPMIVEGQIVGGIALPQPLLAGATWPDNRSG